MSAIQLVFAARPEYLSLTYNYISGCPKYKGTTCLQHIPTTLHNVQFFVHIPTSTGAIPDPTCDDELDQYYNALTSPTNKKQTTMQHESLAFNRKLCDVR